MKSFSWNWLWECLFLDTCKEEVCRGVPNVCAFIAIQKAEPDADVRFGKPDGLAGRTATEVPANLYSCLY